MSARYDRSSDDSEVTTELARSGEFLFNLLVVDPKDLVRDCLIAAIRSADPTATVTGVGSIDDELTASLANDVFDALLVSVPSQCSQTSFVQSTTAAIKAALPGSAIILLAGSTVQSDISMAFRCGVRGYLTAETSLATTIEAIHLVCAGWLVYPSLEARDLMDSRPAAYNVPASWSELLTPRQLEVLNLLALGFPNKSIAFELDMSERTVKAHVKAIMERMGVTNRTQIVSRLNLSRP